MMKHIILGWLVTLLSFTAVAAESKLRVVAYNIHHGVGMDKKLDLERIAKTIAAQKPDFVALQEVDRNCARSKNQDQAAILGKLLGMEHKFGKALNLGSGEYGLAILSKTPISEIKIHKLPGKGEPRIALEAIVQHQGQKMSFVSLHMERNAGEARSLQAKAVIKEFASRKHPVIIAGDYNASRESEPMKFFVKGGWDVLKKNDGNGVRTMHGEKNRKDSASAERIEIDYLVLRGFNVTSYRHGVVQDYISSDHRPIYAKLIIQHK